MKQSYVIVFYNQTKVGLYFYRGMGFIDPLFTTSLDGREKKYPTERGGLRVGNKLKREVFNLNNNVKFEVVTFEEAKKLDAEKVFNAGKIEKSEK